LLEAHQRDEAVALVLRELGPAILGLLHTLFRQRPDAADEAFSAFAERVWTSVEAWRGEASVRTWAYCLARNAAVSVSRDGWRRLGRRLETEEAERLAEEVRTRSALRLEGRSSALDALRDALDAEEQLLLTLRLDQELTWKEVAQVMSTGGELVEEAALRKRFERLKVRLGEAARLQGLLG
jgi:RNA polymerase sigma-70 factor (ECF subfamily)